MAMTSENKGLGLAEHRAQCHLHLSPAGHGLTALVLRRVSPHSACVADALGYLQGDSEPEQQRWAQMPAALHSGSKQSFAGGIRPRQSWTACQKLLRARQGCGLGAPSTHHSGAPSCPPLHS